MKETIQIFGLGYVGFSLAVVLSRHYKIEAFDIDNRKIKFINNGISPIKEKKLEEAFLKNNKNINALNISEFESSIYPKYAIIALPSNFSNEQYRFDTRIIESIIEKIKNFNNDTNIVIKSTIPIGFTEYINKKYNSTNIIFSPEFIREGNSYEDNIYPSRIIVGSENKNKISEDFSKLMHSVAKNNPRISLMSSSEAEAVKLFSNSYLAMRVAFFNEVDSYALDRSLDSKNIIEGICMDDRIGNFYNNPSFGYGGYCLPKDSKQLLNEFNDIPQNIVRSIIESNETRAKFLAGKINEYNVKKVGIFLLSMKKDSDNYRFSSTITLIEHLSKFNVTIIIFEPLIKDKFFNNYKIEKTLTNSLIALIS